MLGREVPGNDIGILELVAGFVVVVVIIGSAVGYLIGGGGVVPTLLALVVAGALAFGSYWKADKIALAVSRARPAARSITSSR